MNIKFVLMVNPTTANPIITNKLSKESVYFDNFVIMISFKSNTKIQLFLVLPNFFKKKLI